MNMTTISGYLTTQEVAEALGVSDARVRQMFAEGKISGNRIGVRSLIFPVKEVNRLKKIRKSDG